VFLEKIPLKKPVTESRMPGPDDYFFIDFIGIAQHFIIEIGIERFYCYLGADRGAQSVRNLS
jgi:hypothetical protein